MIQCLISYCAVTEYGRMIPYFVIGPKFIVTFNGIVFTVFSVSASFLGTSAPASEPLPARGAQLSYTCFQEATYAVCRFVRAACLRPFLLLLLRRFL